LVSLRCQFLAGRRRESANAIGWKVNGAGGEGGSITLLSGPDYAEKRAMMQAIEASGQYREIPIRLSPEGLRVWESPLPDARPRQKK